MTKCTIEHFYQNIEQAPAGCPHFDFDDLYDAVIENIKWGMTVVEVGVYKGQSLAYLCVEANKKIIKLNVFGVDKFTDFHAGSKVYKDFFIETQENLKPVTEKGCAVPQLMIYSSIEGAKQFAEWGFYADFIFVDADHDYDSVLADCEAWGKRCRGLIAGHDYNQSAVKRAVQEYFGDKVVELFRPNRRGLWAVNVGNVQWADEVIKQLKGGEAT